MTTQEKLDLIAKIGEILAVHTNPWSAFVEIKELLNLYEVSDDN